MNKFNRLKRKLALLLAIFTIVTSMPAYGGTAGSGSSDEYPDGVGSGDWIGEGPPSTGGGGGGGSSSPKVTVNVNVDHNDNANTVILDLAKFNVLGFPYELESMREYLKEVPEYRYGDIIDFKEIPFNLSGRQYLEYEEPLIRDGIVRQLSDIYYDSKTESWARQQNFTFNMNDKIDKTYFLASLGRGAGIKDEVYLSSRSTATWVLNQGLRETKYIGRQKIEESPYQKEVQGQVDIGTSIVLVDYNNRDYSVVKLDNIYKPYISYLINIGVLDIAELGDIANPKSFDYSDNKENSIYEMIRVNYSNIPVSSFNKNAESSKDFKWEDTQVTLDPYGGSRLQFTQYDLTSSSNPNPTQQEYKVSGNMGATSYRLDAQVPQYMTNESMTVMDALTYIYKFMWYNEKESVLNELEVDAVMAMYGLKLSNYTQEEIKVLKYLIAKGIINPQEDNLELMRKPLLYKDVVKYLFRLNYPEKRFDFKSVTLSSDDIRLAREGYSQDSITLNTNSNSIDADLEKAKSNTLQQALQLEKTLGYSKIYIKIPNEEYVNSNFILSSSDDMDAVFTVSPIKAGGYVYGETSIPNSYTGDLVLRSTAIGGGYRILLDKWEDKGIYEANNNTGKFVKIGDYLDEDERASVITMNRFAANGNVKIQIDKSKNYTYSGVQVFIDGATAGERILNPDLASIFRVDGDGLTLIGVSTWAQASAIVNRFIAPPGLSSDEITFMGYSQLTVNGEKITMIKDTDLGKLGVEVLEDNVLYNRKLELYGYLDPRASVLYYGNNVVKFKPNTLMLEGIAGEEATFYNLECVKTMLTNVTSNNGITNEILTQLPPDETIQVIGNNGQLYDYVYMHPDTATKPSGDWWINASTLSKQNSNVVFFKDTVSGLNLMINFRARVIKQDDVENNNSFDALMNNLRTKSMDVHPGINKLMQSILGYEGKFSIKDYNYGITVLYDTTGANGSSISEDDAKRHAINAIFNLLKTESSTSGGQNLSAEQYTDLFFGCLSNASEFGGYDLPEVLTRSLSEEFDSNVSRKIRTVGQYYNYARENVDTDLQKTLFLSSQKVEDITLSDKATPPQTDLPAKIVNNNVYFRFTNFNSFKDIDVSGNHTTKEWATINKYRFLDSLIFLYEMNYETKNLKMKYEKVNYENTQNGYIPLEEWNPLVSIGEWRYIKKTSVSLKNSSSNENSYLFDIIELPYGSTTSKPVTLTLNKKPESKAEFLELVFNAMKDSNTNMKEAWARSSSNTLISKGHSYLQENLEKILFESINSNSRLNSDVLKYMKDFTAIKEGSTINFYPGYIFPSGTILVNVGSDYAGALQTKNSYTYTYSINPRPRTALGNSFDLINQNIAQLNKENIKVSEIPAGSSLTLPSSIHSYSLGNSDFIVQDGISVGEGIDDETVLMWNYLSTLNVRVGSSMVLLNAVQGIRLPTREEITNVALSKYNELVKNGFLRADSHLVFLDGNTVKTGKLDTSGKRIITDEVINSNAKIFPIVTFDPNMTAVRVMKNGNNEDVYMVKDVAGSVDLGFVDYLKAGIVDINVPGISEGALWNDDSEDNEVEAFRMKNILIQINKIFIWLKMALPRFLFLYSVSCMVFLILFAMPISRNFIFDTLPEKTAMFLFKVFSLFSVDDMYDLNIPLGFIKSAVIMAISIIWWYTSGL